MKIIYCGYRGTYAAYVMAAIHTGMFKKDILPSPDALQRQWNVCARYGGQYGNLIYMGLDENLSEVYTLGCKGFYDVIKMEYAGISLIFGIDEVVRYIDCRPWDGYLSRIIAHTCQYPWLDNISRKLFLYWIKNVYRSCAENVQREKHRIMTGEGE